MLKDGREVIQVAHVITKGEYRYCCTLSLTSALDGGWSTPRLGRFTPGKDPVPIVNEAGWASEPVWTGAEKLASTGIQFPDRPAHSDSQYQLGYRGSISRQVSGYFPPLTRKAVQGLQTKRPDPHHFVVHWLVYWRSLATLPYFN